MNTLPNIQIDLKKIKQNNSGSAPVNSIVDDGNTSLNSILPTAPVSTLPNTPVSTNSSGDDNYTTSVATPSYDDFFDILGDTDPLEDLKVPVQNISPVNVVDTVTNNVPVNANDPIVTKAPPMVSASDDSISSVKPSTANDVTSLLTTQNDDDVLVNAAPNYNSSPLNFVKPYVLNMEQTILPDNAPKNSAEFSNIVPETQKVTEIYKPPEGQVSMETAPKSEKSSQPVTDDLQKVVEDKNLPKNVVDKTKSKPGKGPVVLPETVSPVTAYADTEENEFISSVINANGY